MPREFYTEKDIEDLVRRGVTSLVVNDEVVLTELAYEKAHRLKMQLLRDRPDNPPSAPVRPYLAKSLGSQPAAVSMPHGALISDAATTHLPCSRQMSSQESAPQQTGGDLHQRIRSAVQARLGPQVDAALLDVIIRRVLAGTGLK
ncbi:MAG: hypothetical protein NTV33_03690 [Coprothermobacterota bacterium]|jgi:hypothetical protein|nr:hypothetical protein [Coprothermobacterota bacterium]